MKVKMNNDIIKNWFKTLMDEHSIDEYVAIHSRFDRDNFISNAWNKNHKVVEQYIEKEIGRIENFEDLSDFEKMDLMVDAIDANSDEIFFPKKFKVIN